MRRISLGRRVKKGDSVCGSAGFSGGGSCCAAVLLLWSPAEVQVDVSVGAAVAAADAVAVVFPRKCAKSGGWARVPVSGSIVVVLRVLVVSLVQFVFAKMH